MLDFFDGFLRGDAEGFTCCHAGLTGAGFTGAGLTAGFEGAGLTGAGFAIGLTGAGFAIGAGLETRTGAGLTGFEMGDATTGFEGGRGLPKLNSHRNIHYCQHW